MKHLDQENIGPFGGALRRQQELQDKVETLESRVKLLEQFSASAAHDLKVPIATISGLCRILNERYSVLLKEDDQKLFDHIMDNCSSLIQLAGDLLSFSSSLNQHFENSRVDLGDILAIVKAHLQLDILESGATINIVGDLPIVWSQQTPLIRLFQNLIDNAIKFKKSKEPLVITIACDTSNEHFLILSVADNGVGIDPMYHEAIFQPFQKFHPNQNNLGSGLGLANCQRIIEKLSGGIWVESQPGEGATFFFTLPLSPSEVPS
ncbi:sensor histidine kinase [Flavilitoribacter nigricans]|nr:ATP-binding protein [Flavilitoribacter nigricans]